MATHGRHLQVVTGHDDAHSPTLATYVQAIGPQLLQVCQSYGTYGSQCRVVIRLARKNAQDDGIPNTGWTGLVFNAKIDLDGALPPPLVHSKAQLYGSL